mmetsp:Transcript_14551/g.38925  ORF Transcript_14551/g.38925 Transcript_14551/m.38925 type:complete len:289 (+) Transcript_14551:792-1658(+)
MGATSVMAGREAVPSGTLSESQLDAIAFGDPSDEQRVAATDVTVDTSVGSGEDESSISLQVSTKAGSTASTSATADEDVLAIETLRISANPSISARLKSAIGMRNRYRSINASLDLYFASEVLDGDEMYVCEHCNKRPAHVPSTRVTSDGQVPGIVKTRAVKRFQIRRLPPVLVLHLKRFSQVTLLRPGLQKALGQVEFPLHLRMDKYMCPASDDEPCAANREQLYTLMAVVVHGGMLYGGHYTAYVREGCDGDFLGGWYYCSDAQVFRVKEKDVLAAEAYMLFYERR